MTKKELLEYLDDFDDDAEVFIAKTTCSRYIKTPVYYDGELAEINVVRSGQTSSKDVIVLENTAIADFIERAGRLS